MNGKGKAICLGNGDGNHFLRPVLLNPRLVDGKLLVPKRWMRVCDKPSCVVIFYKVWGYTGYGAKITKVLHRWSIKSVLRRAGWR